MIHDRPLNIKNLSGNENRQQYFLPHRLTVTFSSSLRRELLLSVEIV